MLLWQMMIKYARKKAMNVNEYKTENKIQQYNERRLYDI